MRPIRTCENAQFSAGVSKCYLDMNKVKGAILVPAGTKLLAEITGEALKKLCHASRSERIYPIFPFVEYAKNGGEAQVNDNGYGGAQSTGVSSRTDALTLDKFYPELNSSMLRCMNMKFDVYYWDEKYVLYGENDGTDILAGFPLSTIYPTGVPHPTSIFCRAREEGIFGIAYRKLRFRRCAGVNGKSRLPQTRLQSRAIPDRTDNGSTCQSRFIRKRIQANRENRRI